MGVVVIGPDEKAKIAELRAYAEANVIPVETMKKASEGFDPDDPSTRTDTTIVGNASYNIKIPIGVSVTFTLEGQPQGLARHLSVSLQGGQRLPHPELMNTLLREFGFTCTIQTADSAWLETYAPGRHAINVVEIIPQGHA